MFGIESRAMSTLAAPVMARTDIRKPASCESPMSDLPRSSYAGEAVAAFKHTFWERIHNDPEYLKRILELKDKRLVCFCNSNTQLVESSRA